MQQIENHPLEPFVPAGAKILMLGSFPPKRERWSMEFFYPNWINDMWRIMGVIFYGNKHHFEMPNSKRFDRERIVEFCTAQGIALYDAASSVRRLKDNASDKFLEVVRATDVVALISSMPNCQKVVTTGEKATQSVAEQLGVVVPAVGQSVSVMVGNREVEFYRMPSSSRAYPLSIEKKAEHYRKIFL